MESTNLEALFGRAGTGEPIAQGTTPSGIGIDIANWFANPNNQKLLAGIGAAINPTPGSIIAQKTINDLIRGKAKQNVEGEQAAAGTDWQAGLSQLAKLLTRPSQPGPTSVEKAEDGSIKAKLTPEATATEAQPAAAPPAQAQPGAASQALPVRSIPALSQIVPFW